jgi:hypothetical protein
MISVALSEMTGNYADCDLRLALMANAWNVLVGVNGNDS